MALSLDPAKNPLLAVYELFRQPGVKPSDEPEFLGFKALKLKNLTSTRAQNLIYFLRRTPTAALRVCRLMFDKVQLFDFAADYVTGWLDRESIEQLSQEQKLCVICQNVLFDVRDALDSLQAGAPWPDEDPEKDSLRVLDALESCASCGERFELETSLLKNILIKEYLLCVSASLQESINVFVWYSAESMQEFFSSFQRFLFSIEKKADKPIAIFLYEPTADYPGDFFKILSLAGTAETMTDREQQMVQQLGAFSIEVLDEYRTLYKKHLRDSRPAISARLDLPPSIFIRRKDDQSLYPSHPLLNAGPLRSALIYAMMYWLAETTRQEQETTYFILPSDAETGPELPLLLSMNDVQIGGHSIFDTSTDWREVVGQIVREIGECAGSKTLREYWINALKHRGPSDFTSAEFFNTLKNVYLEFLAQRREPLQLDESPPGLIDILVFLDAENVKKKLKFQLNSISLGYVYKHVGEVGLGEGNVDLRAVELSKLARDYLSRILVRDKVNPLVEVPSFHKLRTQGVDLWRKLIPDDLKRAYINLRTEKDLTIFIVSDDPSFPWELIKPVEVKGNISQNAFTDDWLAVRFSFARWLSGFPPPAKELSLKRICCVATDGKLTAASEERDHLKKIAVTFDEPQSFDELLRFLGTQDYDLIHFACHGDFNINQPGESVVLLPDGNYLRPSDFLEDGIMAKFNENHPMVFINSCHSGRTGPSLIGIEGWAKELINLGSGAFIGCGWEVNDPLAAKFAVAFYKYFKGGMCMGKAVHEARLEIMRKAPQNSTWLAYYLYGNPDCRIRH